MERKEYYPQSRICVYCGKYYVVRAPRDDTQGCFECGGRDDIENETYRKWRTIQEILDVTTELNIELNKLLISIMEGRNEKRTY